MNDPRFDRLDLVIKDVLMPKIAKLEKTVEKLQKEIEVLKKRQGSSGSRDE
jgi:hypothetical protein